MTTETTTAPPESAAAVEQTEADKIWAEAIAADEPKEPQASVTGEVVSHDMKDASTESVENGNTAASAGTDEKAGDAAKGTEPPATPASKDNDIWATASPELRAAHEAEMAAARKAANDAKAQAGRMRKQFEELQASADKGADTPSSKTVGDTLDQSLAEFPEIAKPVKDALAPIAKQLETLTTAETNRAAERRQQVVEHIRSQQELLDAAHPGWDKEYTSGPKAKLFYDWIEDQPKRLRDIALVTNAEHIFDAQGAIEVFDKFKSDIAAAENPTAGNGQTQELSAKRAAQLDGTTSPRSPSGAPLVSGIPREGDADAIWKAIPDDNADERFLRHRRA